MNEKNFLRVFKAILQPLHFRHTGLIVILANCLIVTGCSSTNDKSQVSDSHVIEDWMISDLVTGRNESVTVLGNPEVRDTPAGEAIWFNGVSDAIILDYNPLLHLASFTVEVIMRPDGDGQPQQRYLHFGESDEDRVLMETRVRDDGQWYHDSFVASGNSQYVQKNPELLHPTDTWYHVALVFDNGKYATWINGELELDGGEVSFTPHTSGRTSIGVRLNEVFWYKGYLFRIRISDQALEADNFLRFYKAY
jgi:hypothetical protein